MGHRRTGRGGGRAAVVAAAVALVLVVAGIPTGAVAPPGRGAISASALSPDHLFLRAAYDDLAGRAPSEAELSAGLAALGAGRTRTQVASELTHGVDHAGEVVDRLYVRILDRPSEPAGRAFWVSRLGSGVRVATLASELYASPEYLSRAGGTPGAYVDAVYRDLLGRAADASGRAYWVGRVAAGESRHVLARLLYLSQESNGLRIVLAYWDLLRRPPEPDARAYWADRLVQTDDLDVEALLVGSEEYLGRAQRPESLQQTTLTALGGAAYDPEVSGDGRIVVFTSLAGPGAGERNRVHLLDRVTGRLRTVGSSNGDSTHPDVSADGSTVVFASTASDLVPGDTNGVSDVFQVPVAGGPVSRLTAGDGASRFPKVSGDGSTVVFSSEATDLVPGDANGLPDVYVRTVSGGGAVGLERIGGDGSSVRPGVSADGSTIAFLSNASDLEGGGADELPRVYVAPLPRSGGGEITRLGEVGGVGIEFGYGAPSLSADGGVITDPIAGQVATITPGGIKRQDVGFDVRLEATVSDDGSTATATGATVVGSASITGRYYSPVEAPGVGTFPHGSLTADGTRLVADRQSRSTLWLGEIVEVDVG